MSFLSGLSRIYVSVRNWAVKSRSFDVLLLVAGSVLILTAWQVRTAFQAQQAIDECLQSGANTILSDVPSCVLPLISENGQYSVVAARLQPATAYAVAQRNPHAAKWCQTLDMAYGAYDVRTPWSAWKQNLWTSEAELAQLQAGRLTCS